MADNNFTWDSKMGFGLHAEKTIREVHEKHFEYLEHCIKKRIHQPIILWWKAETARNFRNLGDHLELLLQSTKA